MILKMHRSMIVVVFISLLINDSDGLSQSNMNGDYLIANPNYDSKNKFSTLYSSYPNVEFFDVYSPPISTRYY